MRDGRRLDRRGGDPRRRRARGQPLLEVGEGLAQGVELPQRHVRIALDREAGADGGEDVHLLDRVDPEIRLEVEIELQHLLRVPRLRDRRCDQLAPKRLLTDDRLAGCHHCLLLHCGRGRGPQPLDEGDQVSQARRRCRGRGVDVEPPAQRLRHAAGGLRAEQLEEGESEERLLCRLRGAGSRGDCGSRSWPWMHGGRSGRRLRHRLELSDAVHEAEGEEPLELLELADLGMDGGTGRVGKVLERLARELRQRPARAGLEEQPQPLGMGLAIGRAQADRLDELAGEEPGEVLRRAPAVEPGVDAGDDRHRRRREGESPQRAEVGLAGASDERRVVAVRDREDRALEPLLLAAPHELGHRLSVRGDDAGLGAVVRGEGGVAGNACEELRHALGAAAQGGHASGVPGLQLEHREGAGADGPQPVGERQRSGLDECRQLARALPRKAAGRMPKDWMSRESATFTASTAAWMSSSRCRQFAGSSVKNASVSRRPASPR